MTIVDEMAQAIWDARAKGGPSDYQQHAAHAAAATVAERLRETVELVARYCDCGDNSCLFVRKRDEGGMRTNGGCRCVERSRPFLAQALGRLFTLADALLDELEGKR